jgi:NADH-quinone oxidoreductase subunit M
MPSEQLELLRVLLVVMLALPAAAAVVVALLGPGRALLVRWVSLAAVVIDLALAAILAAGFAAEQSQDLEPAPTRPGELRTFHPLLVPGETRPASAEDEELPPKSTQRTTTSRTSWQLLSLGNAGGIYFFLGLDGLNVWLVVLTALLMVSSVLISWNSITERVHEFHAWLLALGTGLMGVFLSFDIIVFYVFFELTLVPLFFLIGIWGGPERRLAARKFFIYTLTGSLITLLGVLAVVLVCYHNHPQHRLTFAIPELVHTLNNTILNAPQRSGSEFWGTFQVWVFLALAAGFAIKVPLVPLHTWLPLAHVEAPTAGSVLLAGVLLKLGAYGFLRLCLPLTPDACLLVGLPLIGLLAVVGIIYGALCAFAQNDIKKLVAYSSVSHMGFCMLGMFALNGPGLTGSLLQMINHGLSTGALFLLVGMLYERYHTRLIADYSGMGSRLGMLAVAFIFISLSSIGLPGLNGFVGETLCFFGMFETSPALAVVGTAGIVLGAWYLLTLVQRVYFGPLREPHAEGHGPIGDLNLREWLAVGPIMVLCVVLGVYPQPVIDTARPDIDVITNIVDARRREQSRYSQVPLPAPQPNEQLKPGR